MKKSNAFIKALSITLAIVGIVALFFVYANEQYDKENAYVEEEVIPTIIDDKEYLEKEVDTICIVGLDTYEQIASDSYTNAQMADFVYLLVIDDQNRTITPVHINRDSMVNYNVLGIKGDIITTTYGQIAASHNYGDGGVISLNNVKDALSALFYDCYINYSLSLTMDAIPVINDALGGVDVYVDYDFSNSDSTIIQGEVNHLEGEHALNFVRARGEMEDKTNLTRMKRQRSYLDALFNKFTQVCDEDDDLITDTLDQVSDYIVTNAHIGEIQNLLVACKDYELKETMVLGGEAKKGETYMEYYVDEASVKEIATTLLFEECK